MVLNEKQLKQLLGRAQNGKRNGNGNNHNGNNNNGGKKSGNFSGVNRGVDMEAHRALVKRVAALEQKCSLYGKVRSRVLFKAWSFVITANNVNGLTG